MFSRLHIRVWQLLTLVSFTNTSTLRCDTLPKDKSTLNFTSVYFEEDCNILANEYILTLDTDSTAIAVNNTAKKISRAIPAFRISDLKWNTRYFWKVTAYDKRRREIYTGKVHRFTILKQTAVNVDSVFLNVRVNKKDRHAGGLICVDYARSIYDRSGNAVWTIPFIKNCVDERTQVRDMRITQDNTITFLTDKFPLEIDLKGTVLWKAPFPFILNGDTVFYHHDFKKTRRGTYMVLGNKKIDRRVYGNFIKTAQFESETRIVDSVIYKKTMMTLLLEFNEKGKLIWFWDANGYITDTDLNETKSQSGFPEFTTHSNAFSEDQAGNKVYIGFRDLSRIIKIDKKTKGVEMCYGSTSRNSDENVSARNLFRRQHDATITDRNTILVFNNNNPGTDIVETPYASSILELKENAAKNEEPLLWHFDLDFDTLTNGRSTAGGNVAELPNTNLLLCAGTLNRIFEVTRDKKIVWDAFVLIKTKNDSLFRPFPQYRCNWTGQLKEFHFIARILSSKRTNEKLIINIGVTNTGNTDDQYEITVFSKAVVLNKKKTNLIAPDNFFELIFDLPIYTCKEGIGIEIRSKNSNYSKTLTQKNFGK